MKFKSLKISYMRYLFHGDILGKNANKFSMNFIEIFRELNF